MSQVVSCPMCGDQSQDPNTSGIIRLYGENALPSAILWESKHLYLIPAPGTLMAGYLIVASKDHLVNFAHVPDVAITDLLRVLQAVSTMGADNGLAPYIMFEHGSGGGDAQGASCVDHAHMHLTPCRNPNKIRMQLAAHFSERSLDKLEDVRSLSAVAPYVLLHFGSRSYVYESVRLPCQFVRRILAAEVGVPDQWSWFDYPFPENFWRTWELCKMKLTDPVNCN